MTIPKWKHAIMQYQIKKALIKVYKKHESKINEIKDILEQILTNEEDKYAQTLIATICASIILGFEDQKTKQQTLQQIEILIKEIN